MAFMTSSLDRLRDALAGRYAIERELGAGGMARVYLASDLRHHRSVAVKVLRPEFLMAVTRERFLREIETVANLTHPHILPLHDSGAVDDLCFFVMPYVEGESLRERLDREGPLPVAEALRIAREIADALAYAHSRGVIHRDIKPRNIMMEADHAVVADFGIALLLNREAGDRLTTSGLSPGTPQYMSPEQGYGDHRLDGRSDIYSLGCVLYEMLAGDPPYTGSNVHAIMARKTTEPPPSIRNARDTVTEGVESVTMKALARTPADRYRSAAEMLEALTEAANEHHLRRSDPAVRNLATVSSDGGRLSGAARLEDAEGTRARIRLASTALRVSAAAVAVTGLLATVGYLSTKAFDLKLQVPARYTPSRTDFLPAGAEALFPVMVFGFVTALAWLILRAFMRLVLAGASRIPTVGVGVHSVRARVARKWHALWNEAQPSTVAELYLVGAILLSIMVHVAYWSILVPLFTSETERWACAYRPDHRELSLTLTALVVGLAFSRVHVFRRLSARASPRELAVPRWGSLLLVVALVVSQTLPWRLVWDVGHERVDLAGERGYVLIETADELVIYNADRRTTVARGRDEPGITRRHIAGYIFEEPEVFASSVQECLSVTEP